jgi:hypothetical protein
MSASIAKLASAMVRTYLNMQPASRSHGQSRVVVGWQHGGPWNHARSTILYVEPTPYKFDVTEFVRNNPNSSYFFAARNLDAFNVRVTGIQLSIFYR